MNEVLSLLIDRSGTLWLGRGAKGLYKITPGTNRFISRKYLHGNLDLDILTRELNLKSKDLPPALFASWLSYYFRKAITKKKDLIWIQNWFLGDFTTLYFDTRVKVLSKVVPLYRKAQMGIDVDSDPKIKCPLTKKNKTPDWLLEANDQTILAEVLRISAMTEPQLREHIAHVNHINRLNVEHGSIKYTSGMSRSLDCAYYCNCQSALETKERRYRPIIHERKWPFIICPSPYAGSFIDIRETYDFFVAKGKGFLYTNEFFRRNVTGILLKSPSGEFVYFHNENAENKLNQANYDVFQLYSYDKEEVG